MIAVSLNGGGGVRLIKPTKLYICTQNHYKHNEDGRTAPGVCGSGSVPLVGWSGGAMVLGKLPVPGRPTIWIVVGQGPTALAVGAGGG